MAAAVQSMVVIQKRQTKTCRVRRNKREPDATCVCVLQSGQFSEDMIPTVGFNMRKITKGNVTIKVGSSIPHTHTHTHIIFYI